MRIRHGEVLVRVLSSSSNGGGSSSSRDFLVCEQVYHVVKIFILTGSVHVRVKRHREAYHEAYDADAMRHQRKYTRCIGSGGNGDVVNDLSLA